VTGGPPAESPRRVLVTRLRRIGDAILSLPVLDALRERFPAAAIDFMAEEGPAQAAVGHPAVNRIVPIPTGGASPLPAPWGLLKQLRRERYDWVIDLYGNPRSAILSAWTGAPIRVGPDRRARRRLYTHVVPGARTPLSAVDHHLRALAVLGVPVGSRAPRLHLSDDERERGMAVIREHLPGEGPIVGLHVSNRWSAKRWAEANFASLIRVLSRRGARAAILAGPGEEALAARVLGTGGAPRAAVISGLPLRTYWSVVAALDVLVTNDGSPLHAGPAVGTPTVGILGPTVPEIWFPYAARDGHQLLCKDIWCRPCHRHECARLDCLEWISVSEAAGAVERALARGGTRDAVA